MRAAKKTRRGKPKKLEKPMILDAPTRSEWRYIEQDLELCEKQLPRLTRLCEARKSRISAEDVCEMCRSTFGAFIDADHFVRTLRTESKLDQIIELFDQAYRAVYIVASVLSGGEKTEVACYARNIAMRSRILKRFRSHGEDASVELMHTYALRIARADVP